MGASGQGHGGGWAMLVFILRGLAVNPAQQLSLKPLLLARLCSSCRAPEGSVGTCTALGTIPPLEWPPEVSCPFPWNSSPWGLPQPRALYTVLWEGLQHGGLTSSDDHSYPMPTIF